MFDIVIPVFNEENRLPKTLGVLIDYAARTGKVGKIIIVDDHSTDGTAALAREWSAKNATIVCLTSAAKGKGSAVKTGMLTSRADFTLFSDADLSTPIECAETLLTSIQDIAIASRHVPGSRVTGQDGLRKLMSWGVNMLDHLVLGNDVKDSQCGFKLFSRRARQIIFPRQTIDGFAFDMELLTIARLHALKVIEVPVTWVHNTESRVRAVSDSLNIFREMLRIRRNILQKKYA